MIKKNLQKLYNLSYGSPSLVPVLWINHEILEINLSFAVQDNLTNDIFCAMHEFVTSIRVFTMKTISSVSSLLCDEFHRLIDKKNHVDSACEVKVF